MIEKPSIKYCKGYKYQLREIVFIQTNVFPETDIKAELVSLSRSGLMAVLKYFAWDGCSGPTKDDDQNMVPCLAHDAFAYLIRIGALPTSYIPKINKELERLMLLYRKEKEGFKAWLLGRRANLYCWMVDHCGNAWATKPRIVYISPKG